MVASRSGCAVIGRRAASQLGGHVIRRPAAIVFGPISAPPSGIGATNLILSRSPSIASKTFGRR
ncbi:MAG: hypothetical protein ACJAVS_000872 [Paracoccaceae bacterium]|jgi:hypothetical protein